MNTANRDKRLLLMLTLLCAALLFCACGNNGALHGTDTDGTLPAESDTTASAGLLEIFAGGTTAFRLVWPARPEDDEYNAVILLRNSFEACGVTVKDTRDTSSPASDCEYEILIGGTNRAESESFGAGLKDNDYTVAVSGTRLVIIGGSPTATLAAAQAFINEYIPSVRDALSVPEDLLMTESETYGVADFSVNGISITSFTIVKPAAASKLEQYAASLLGDIISERTGVTLDIINDRTAASGPEIRVGATSRSGDKCGDFEYVAYAEGDSVILNGDKHSVVRAVLDFTDKYLPESSDTAVDAKIDGQRTVVSTADAALPAEPTLDGRRVVALCDQKNASLVMIDLDAPDPTSKDAVIWEWKPTTALGFSRFSSGYGNRIDEAVLRYSEPLGKYVVCVTSSSGYMCVAEYPSGNCVWEGNAQGLGPHSIDYLPDGNVAVVCSGNSNTDAGCLRIYTASAGRQSAKYAEAPLVSAHGVLWDDENRLLWALGAAELRAYRIGGTSSAPELIEVDGLGGATAVSGCHNLSVCGDDTDCLWISGSAVIVYRKSTGSYIRDYDGAAQISEGGVKSVDSFADGTVVRARATNVYAAHDTDTLLVTTPGKDGKAETRQLVFADRAFYKARRVCAQYS